jgi:methylthioribose-1-phosphate isomerase
VKVDGRWRRAIELADDRASVVVLDQAKLPYEIAWLHLRELDDFVRAIRDMHVRGAPLIGATAAYGSRSRCRPAPATPRTAPPPRRARPRSI